MADSSNNLNKKLRGLFLNTAQANCSIYESGKMVYKCLLLSEKYAIDYIEIDSENREVKNGYDFYAFNYHHDTMSWLDTKSIGLLPGLKLTFVLETLKNDPFVLCPRDAFDVYCALDPTMSSADKRVHAFPRPLESASIVVPYQEKAIPVIGSFGFATPGKGFELVVDAVNKEFDKAIVRINIPPGTHADPATYKLHNRDYADYLSDLCKKTSKKGIEVIVTRDYMSKEDLIQWCSQNTLNCFLYNRNQPGLSATTDQAISSGRPLAVSTNETFRHIHAHLTPYPFRSLKESIESSQPEVSTMQDSWSPRQFVDKFERVLDEFNLLSQRKTRHETLDAIELKTHFKIKGRPLLGMALLKCCQHVEIADFVPPVFPKAVKRLRSRLLSNSIKSHANEGDLLNYSHGLLKSYSQHHEDLLVDFIFQSRELGFYVDVGANDPTFNSNTKRFYDRGWSGINIEPGVAAFKKLVEARPRDINLNFGVAQKRGMLTFHQLSDDTTLSSFKEEDALKMARRHNLTLETIKVETQPLRDILSDHLKNRHIDFMSVDTEGLDLQVLQSNDWHEFRPSVLLVEMNNEYAHILKYLSEQSYLLILNNSWNGLFVDQKTSDADLKAFFVS